MSIVSWLRKPKPSGMAERRRTDRTSRQRSTFRPRLEALEDRWMPSTLTVTNNLDYTYTPIPGSLRYEIGVAQSGDTIVFDKSVKTITLSGGELGIGANLTIQGPGANNLKISGGYQSRVFVVGQLVQVTLSGMTIEKGDGAPCNCGTVDPNLDGGGILNFGTLTLSNCTVSGNSAGQGGGGIANELGGTMTISGCTVSGNSSYIGFGAGIYNDGTMTLSGSTVTQNDGPGIYNDYKGILTILNSIVKSNHDFDLYNLGTWSADSSSTIGKIGP